MREMSGKQFHEEFGGGSLSRVDQNFRVLEKEGWLTYVRTEGPGGRRHGAEEHFYRALKPAYFDRETWGLMPYSIRAASSWNIARQVAPRLRHALERSVSPTQDIRNLSCATFVLDEEGWTNALLAVGEHFVRVFDEQENARRRASLDGSRLTRTDVFSFAFEQATPGVWGLAGPLLQATDEPLSPFPERLALILKDEVRLQIVDECNRREVSVTGFHRDIGGASRSALYRRFKSLEAGGWIAKGRKQGGGSRRGATEQYYRATRPPIPQFNPCADPPESLRSAAPWRVFEELCGQMKDSMLAGTFDARLDRCVNWSFVSLDRKGRQNVIQATDDLLSRIEEEAASAQGRLDRAGTKPIKMRLALAVLEASEDSSKAP